MASQNTLFPKEQSEVLEELTSDSQGTGLEVEREPSPEGAIRAPFDPSTIDVITQVRTVDLLLARLREGELDLSPDFQAGGRTLIPKNAFSWRVPHPMVLRVRVLTFFQPGAPGI
jgi:hypothetical protein